MLQRLLRDFTVISSKPCIENSWVFFVYGPLLSIQNTIGDNDSEVRIRITLARKILLHHGILTYGPIVAITLKNRDVKRVLYFPPGWQPTVLGILSNDHKSRDFTVDILGYL